MERGEFADIEALSRAHREAWSVQAELLATLIDTINQWGRTWAVANSKKGTKIPESPRVKRPYEAVERPLTMGDILAAVRPVG